MAGQVILYRSPAESDSSTLLQRIVDFISSDVIASEPSALTGIYGNVLTASPTFAAFMLAASVLCIYLVAKSMKSVSA